MYVVIYDFFIYLYKIISLLHILPQVMVILVPGKAWPPHPANGPWPKMMDSTSCTTTPQESGRLWPHIHLYNILK